MYLTLLALPLSSYVCLSLFGRHLGARGAVLLAVGSALCSAMLAWALFYEVALCACPCVLSCGTYFASGLADAGWGFLYDSLTAVMAVVVTNVSGLVIVYSCSYMIQDPHFIRFMSYLKLFTVAMLVLVTGDNYAQLFAGWEGVGLASFLLISFWYNRLQASKAAIQAMLLNRVGDIGLALGLICLYFSFRTWDYRALAASVGAASMGGPGLVVAHYGGFSLIEWGALGLFIGAVGKSGQFGLHAWLPNAMNAPTPVSALLHAATMVTAGVFLLARSSPLLADAPACCALITVLGAVTTLYAGSVGALTYDLKGVIAYSTISQLGYMVAACGLSHPHVAMFHLTNHACFKALLFLSAGAVIHSLADQQDIRRYGGLQQVLTFSYACLLVGTLALVGTPYLAGFYSKDVILELAAANYGLSTGFGYSLTCFSVLTTSYYGFRLLYLTFHGGPGVSGAVTNVRRRDVPSHDAPNTMILVLSLLACGSLVVGYWAKPMFIGLGSDFWGACLPMPLGGAGLVEAEFLPQALKLVPLGATLTGGALAYAVSVVAVPQVYRQTYRAPGLVRFLNQRWYYDKLLNAGLAYPGYRLGYALLANFDKGLLELLPGTGLALPRSLRSTYTNLGSSQSGLISHYALVMVFSSLLALVALTSAGPSSYGDGRTVLILISALSVL